MKIAISSQGNTLDSLVDSRFGRSAFFIVADTETMEFTCHDNTQNLNAAQGAGIQAARHVIEFGVEAILTGNLGPKAFTTLEAGKIAMYTGVTGTVREAIEQLRNDQIKSVTKPNVEGHWV